MVETVDPVDPLAVNGLLDLLVVGPLPYRNKGQDVDQRGGVLYNVALLQGLRRLGHDVRVLATGPPQPGRLEPGDLGPDISVEWFAVEYLTARTPPAPAEVEKRCGQLERAVDRAIAERRPDLVVLGHEAQVFYADACLERGLPTVLFAHGVPTHGLLDGVYPPSALEALLERLSAIDLIVTVSRHLEAILRALGLVRVRTIRTGIDAEAFSPRRKDPALLASHGIEDDRFVVGSFSRMRAIKRVADLVASAELVLRSQPRVLFLLAGDCPERQAVVDLVERMGLGESVRFLGEIDHTCVPDYMALCDAVVLASEREGFGLSVLEAQACGRAVIASDIPAVRELVDDRRTGRLFPVGDVEALADRILELVTDGSLRRTLEERARASALALSSESWIRACSEMLIETARVRDAR